mmetsp:Transcript_2182/g.7987  ORF Transcript_2182/g.7987 Transcript_2182/m.7987 type:complete len:223 (-) Transcript_2182:3114-3782(-)
MLDQGMVPPPLLVQLLAASRILHSGMYLRMKAENMRDTKGSTMTTSISTRAMRMTHQLPQNPNQRWPLQMQTRKSRIPVYPRQRDGVSRQRRRQRKLIRYNQRSSAVQRSPHQPHCNRIHYKLSHHRPQNNLPHQRHRTAQKPPRSKRRRTRRAKRARNRHNSPKRMSQNEDQSPFRSPSLTSQRRPPQRHRHQISATTCQRIQLAKRRTPLITHQSAHSSS